MRKNILKIICITFGLIFLLKGFVCAAEVIDKIVAVVNDDIITQSEVQESMLPFVADYRMRYGEEELEDKLDEAKSDALNRLIEEKLILQEAKRREVVVADEEAEARIQEVKANFKSDEEFQEAIEASGVTIAKLKNKYKEQLMMKKLVSGLINSKVNITPTQVAAYYYGHREDFMMPKLIRVKILLLKPTPERNKENTEKLAYELDERIGSGEDFDALVKEYSQGPNVDKGGDMGYVPDGSIIKEINEVVGKLEVGQTSGIVRTQAGFIIVKLVDTKEAGLKSFEEMQDIIKERLFQREAELTLREFMDNLKEDAYIKINE